jgi:hypothetical protein
MTSLLNSIDELRRRGLTPLTSAELSNDLSGVDTFLNAGSQHSRAEKFNCDNAASVPITMRAVRKLFCAGEFKAIEIKAGYFSKETFQKSITIADFEFQ